MKLIRFEKNGREGIAALTDQGAVDLSESCGNDINALIGGWDQQREVAEAAVRRGPAVPLESLRLLAPVAPGLILCSGENYWDHRNEKPPVAPREPEFFTKTSAGIVAPGDPVERDERVTQKLDYEVELAVVIGRAGRHLTPQNALSHVFGYTIMNDCTARDRQVQMRPDGTSYYLIGPGKNFDTCAPFGPCIVTADEFGDPQAGRRIRSYVNGELRQSNTTDHMIWPCAELLAFFSRNLTLRPGWVISTGTPGGTAWASDPELGGRPYARDDVSRPSGYLQPGDVVRCEIEGIGAIENPIVAGGG